MAAGAVVAHSSDCRNPRSKRVRMKRAAIRRLPDCRELIMTDIDSSHRRMLTRFGVYQMTNNPAGIGNECTHWIYAALFEARALDEDKALKIRQSGIPYTWGRPITADAAQPGDIAQFHGLKNTFFVYQTDGSR